MPPVRNCSAPCGSATDRWQIRNRAIALGVSLIILPIVFLMGFCTRGAFLPAHQESVRSAKTQATGQVAAARQRKNRVARPVAKTPQVLAAGHATAVDIVGQELNADRPNLEMLPKQVARRRPPKPSTIAANLDTDAQPFNQMAAAAADAAPALPEPLGNQDAVDDGFALRTPVSGQFVANVQVPGNSWFSLAGATAGCESGTCKLVPVKTADRKLNTALEWSSTPQQAAELAAREGKLVFLIHVSGNFARPGFT
jgi:hypothetical protein